MLRAGGMPVLTDGQRAADADNERGYFEFEPVTHLRRENAWIPQAQGKAVKIVAQLLRYLPQKFRYRLLFIHRDLREIIASQTIMLARHKRAGGALDAERLITALNRQIEWVVKWLDWQPHIQVIHLEYDNVLIQPSIAANRINRFLGGSLDESAMAAAVVPSMKRQHRTHPDTDQADPKQTPVPGGSNLR